MDSDFLLATGAALFLALVIVLLSGVIFYVWAVT